jgi:hypothetical protein
MLSSNLGSSCLSLPSIGIIGVCHYAKLQNILFVWHRVPYTIILIFFFHLSIMQTLHCNWLSFSLFPEHTLGFPTLCYCCYLYSHFLYWNLVHFSRPNSNDTCSDAISALVDLCKSFVSYFSFHWVSSLFFPSGLWASWR